MYYDVLHLRLIVCVRVYRGGEDQKGMVNDEPKRKYFEMIYQYLGSKADAERKLRIFWECQIGITPFLLFLG